MELYVSKGAQEEGLMTGIFEGQFGSIPLMIRAELFLPIRDWKMQYSDLASPECTRQYVSFSFVIKVQFLSGDQTKHFFLKN